MRFLLLFFNAIYQRPEGKSFLFLLALLISVWAWESFPPIDHARTMFPTHFNQGLSCFDILAARPWYGRVNPWAWFFFASLPLVVFALQPNAPVWQRMMRPIIAVGLGYATIFLGVDLELVIREAPFYTSEIRPDSSYIEKFKYSCNDIGDTQVAAAFLLGWLPALVYTGWWDMAWYEYHKRKTKLIDGRFKRDWISRIVVFLSIALPALIAAWAGWRWGMGG